MNIIDDTVIDLTSSMMLACLQLFICILVCFQFCIFSLCVLFHVCFANDAVGWGEIQCTRYPHSPPKPRAKD